MQVRDLIHLLQTRCKPEDDVMFTSFTKSKDGTVMQTFGDIENSFNVLWREDIDQSETDPCTCLINVGDQFLNNLFVDLEDIDLEKITKGTLDANGIRKLKKE